MKKIALLTLLLALSANAFAFSDNGFTHRDLGVWSGHPATITFILSKGETVPPFTCAFSHGVIYSITQSVYWFPFSENLVVSDVGTTAWAHHRFWEDMKSDTHATYVTLTISTTLGRGVVDCHYETD